MDEDNQISIVLVAVGLLAVIPAVACGMPFDSVPTAGLVLTVLGICQLCAQLRSHTRLPKARAARMRRTR